MTYVEKMLRAIEEFENYEATVNAIKQAALERERIRGRNPDSYTEYEIQSTLKDYPYYDEYIRAQNYRADSRQTAIMYALAEQVTT